MFVPLSIKTHSFNLDVAIVPLKLKSLSMDTQSRADYKSSGFFCVSYSYEKARSSVERKPGTSEEMVKWDWGETRTGAHAPSGISRKTLLQSKSTNRGKDGSCKV